MPDPLIQAGNNATQAVSDNNIQQTQASNAAYVASNPNTFGQNSTTPPVLTPAQGFNNTQTPVPTVTSPDTSGAIVAGAKNTAQNLDQTISSLTPQPTELDNQQQSLLNDVATLTGQDSGKDQAYLDAEKASGATQANTDLTALNNKLKTMTATYDQMESRLGGNGTIESSAVYTAQNAGLIKARAADIGMVTAQIQAKQGDLALATKTAHDSVDARYSTVEDNIKTKLAQLQALQPKLDAQQKTQALAQQKILEDQKQQVADEKAQAKDNVALALTAGITTKYVNKNGQFFDAATGKPFSTPQEFFDASGVKSFEEAYQKGLVTDFSKAKVDEQNFVSQLAAKYPDAGIKLNDTQEAAQAKLANSKIYHKETYIAPPAVARSTPAPTYGGNNVIAGVTLPSNVSATDVQAVLEGRETALDIRQTVGRSKEGDAKMQALRDAIFKIDPNFDFVASNAGGKLVSSTYYQKSLAAINSVMPNIDKVVDLSNQVSRVGVVGVDKLLQAGKVQIGNKQVANFHEAQKLIADEIGLALGQGSVSDMKLQLGFDVTDPSVSPEVFASNMQIVKEFIDNRKKGLEDQRYTSSVDTKSSQAGFSVQAPDGQTYNFNSQADLDAFKKAASIK